MNLTQPVGNSFGQLVYSPGVLTAGSLTAGVANEVRSVILKFSWTNAMVVALGAALSGNIAVCTLPAKTRVNKASIVITGQGAGTTTLTVSMGRTGALYADYLVAKTAQASANTVYGQAATDLGTNLSAIVGDLPSLSGTTVVNLQFISTVSNLSAVTGSTGDVYLETTLLP